MYSISSYSTDLTLLQIEVAQWDHHLKENKEVTHSAAMHILNIFTTALVTHMRVVV